MNSNNQKGVESLLTRMIVSFLIVISTFVVFGPSSVQAVGEPTVSWVSDDNQVVAGVASFGASAIPTSPATIKKWCLTFDGSPVTTNVAAYNSTSYNDIYYDTTFSAQTGCWSSSSSNLRTAKVKWDTTTWAAGPHTLQWTVTDTSNRLVTSSVLNFTTRNRERVV